jgi:L-malate glycosyltransferase
MDYGIETEPSGQMQTLDNSQLQSTTANEILPQLFLMINSLETGGSERQFAALTRSLNPSLFEQHLGCIMEKGAFLDGLGPFSSFSLGGSLYGAKSFRNRIRLARQLRKNNIAVAHAFDFYTNLFLIPVARLAGVPVVLGSQRQIGDLLTSGQSRAQAMAFRLCDRVICNSQAAADHLLKQGIRRGKLVVIRNGLPPSAFADATPALAAIPGLLRVGMIARMNLRAKNHLALLKAAAGVVSKFPAVEFVLVGDGPLRSELEQEARSLGLGNHVRFLGDRRDVRAVLASLDLTVLPSSSESLSNSIIESMAAGVPVVANRVGGNAELIDDGRGVLVTEGDESELATAIESLLRDEGLRKKLGQDAKAYAEANLTIEQMCRSHEELYTALLERKGWRAKAHR